MYLSHQTIHCSMTAISADFINTCIALARENSQGSTDTKFSELSLSHDSASRMSSPSLPGPISTEEAESYYSGLYSSPVLVYRTGTTPWTKPTGPEAYHWRKELRPVFRHKINDVWEELGPPRFASFWTTTGSSGRPSTLFPSRSKTDLSCGLV